MTFEAQGIPMHTADRLPPPSGTDRHLYISIGNHEHHAQLSQPSDVILSAFMVRRLPSSSRGSK